MFGEWTTTTKGNMSTTTIRLTLSNEQAYQRKQRLWKAFLAFERTVIRAFFPDTGGSEHLMHNWYRCDGRNNPKGAKLADWVKDTTWGRYYRLETKMKERDTEREHKRHGDHFRPLWCPICTPKQ